LSFSDCKVRRTLWQTLDGKFNVYERNTHLLVGGVEHLPEAVNHRLQQKEVAALKDILTKRPTASKTELHVAITQSVINSSEPPERVQNWLTHQRRLNPLVSLGDTPLQAIQTWIDDLKSGTSWEGSEDHRTLLLPVPDGYLFVGDAAQGKSPAKSPYGHPYAFVLPLSTPELLTNRLQSKRVAVYSVPRITATSILSKVVPNKGFQLVDAVYKMFQDDVAIVISVGTVTRTSQFRQVAIAIAHGESGWAIQATLQSIQAGCELVYPDQDCSCSWTLADCGRGVQAGIAREVARVSQVGDFCDDSDFESAGTPVVAKGKKRKRKERASKPTRKRSGKEKEWPADDRYVANPVHSATRVPTISVAKWPTAICSVHVLLDGLPKMIKFLRGDVGSVVTRDIWRMTSFPWPLQGTPGHGKGPGDG